MPNPAWSTERTSSSVGCCIEELGDWTPRARIAMVKTKNRGWNDQAHMFHLYHRQSGIAARFHSLQPSGKSWPKIIINHRLFVEAYSTCLGLPVSGAGDSKPMARPQKLVALLIWNTERQHSMIRDVIPKEGPQFWIIYMDSHQVRLSNDLADIAGTCWNPSKKSWNFSFFIGAYPINPTIHSSPFDKGSVHRAHLKFKGHP